jgi:hypothetical protein
MSNRINWSNACDFNGYYFKYKQIPNNECGKDCESTLDCTHFTWTTYNGGTCYLKSGKVSRSDAVYTGDSEMRCGFLSSINSYLNYFIFKIILYFLKKVHLQNVDNSKS